eukprot:3256878-Pyramimonas_sp.AAC.1
MIADIGKQVHDPTYTILAGDWNLPPQVLEASGVPRKLGMLVMAPIERTCRTPSTNSTIDFFLMGPGLSRLISGVSAVMSWDVKPHRPVQLKVRADALSLRQLVYRSYQRLPVLAPFGPRPRPPAWRGVLAHAGRAAASAMHEKASAAWSILNNAWAHFAGVANWSLLARWGSSRPGILPCGARCERGELPDVHPASGDAPGLLPWRRLVGATRCLPLCYALSCEELAAPECLPPAGLARAS